MHNSIPSEVVACPAIYTDCFLASFTIVVSSSLVNARVFQSENTLIHLQPLAICSLTALKHSASPDTYCVPAGSGISQFCAFKRGKYRPVTAMPFPEGMI